MTPAESSARSKKSAATRMARYGPNIFKKMGSKGGKTPRPKPVDDMPLAEQYEALPGDGGK